MSGMDNFKQTKAQKKLRKLRMSLVPHEPYTRQQVFDRDEGICQICKKPVDPSYYHIDHIVPVVYGGPDKLENVRLAHPECNLDRPRKLITDKAKRAMRRLGRLQ